MLNTVKRSGRISSVKKIEANKTKKKIFFLWKVNVLKKSMQRRFLFAVAKQKIKPSNATVNFQNATICDNFACKNSKFWHISESFIFFNWNSLHARLNSHYKAWSYKKKKHKKIKAYMNSVYKEPTVKKMSVNSRLKSI